MTAAASVAFPPSRTLATWWSDLRPWQPIALWVRHLTLFRVEALVRVVSGHELDVVSRLALEALGHRHTLPLGPQLLHRIHGELTGRGLISGQSLTPLGEKVLRGEKVLPTTTERRTFYFVKPHEGPAQFLPLLHPPTTAVSSSATFNVADLGNWIQRPTEVKQRAGFPLDVVELVSREAVTPEERWQQVALAHVEQLSLLLMLTNTESGEQLRGFAFQPGTWHLNVQQPALTLGASWREQLPELTIEPSAEQWRQAWYVWGQPRSLSTGDMEACSLERQGTLLRVHAPGRLIEQLRRASSDALKGETWLLTGNGSTRSLALVELVEQR